MKRPRQLTACLTFACLFLVGCGGSAKLSFISMHSQSIDPPRVEPYDFHAQECYWWIDEDGDLCLAVAAHEGSLFLGRLGDVDVELSFVLGKPPAGSGRDYALSQRGVRSIVRSAMQNQRFNAISGVISVLTKPGDEMHGSFRIWMTPMYETGLLSFLPGKPGPLLCYARFKAVKDPGRGRAVLRRTEEGAPRPPKATASDTPPTTPPGITLPQQKPTPPVRMAPSAPPPRPTTPGRMEMVPFK